MITNLINRYLIVYEKWEAMKQWDIKILIFKTYFEKLEDYLLSFEEKHKANFFLVKLRSKLKNKILNINNVFKLRKKILIMIIMQKNILNRNRAEDEFNNQSSFKNFNESKKRKS